MSKGLNNVFNRVNGKFEIIYDEELKQFRLWYLNFIGGVNEGLNTLDYRQVARTESTDFLNWTRAELVLERLNTRFQTHCLPVFYYAGVYLGMPGIWETMGEIRINTELALSPDTVNWHRINPGTSFIPNSDVKVGHDYGMVLRYILQLFLDSDEVWIYYGGWRDGARPHLSSLKLPDR